MDENKVNALFDTIDYELKMIAHTSKDKDSIRLVSALQHKISAERTKLKG